MQMLKDVKVDVKEMWCLEPKGGGCEGAVVSRASSWWM